MEEKIKNYRTAPFDARFPNTNQTRNCFQNYLGEQTHLWSNIKEQSNSSHTSWRTNTVC